MKNFKNAIPFFEDMHGQDSRWLVGVSGGGDSVALLRMLVDHGDAARLIVGHFNHHWSSWGDEAEGFVRDLCARLGIELLVGHGNGKAIANAEAKAREERFTWFNAVCRERELQGVVLAHTRTDMAENFLLRAGKGSGLKGLASIGKAMAMNAEGFCLWRPLLDVSRNELRAYLQDIGQNWLDDPDNIHGKGLRVRLRALLPQLEQAGVGEEALAAAITALGRADDVVEEAADTVCRQICHSEGHALFLKKQDFSGLKEELAVRVLARVLRQQGVGMLPRRSKVLLLMDKIAATPSGKAQLAGAEFVWDAGMVRVGKE